MDLKDFVKETLGQIVTGVKEAQDVVREQGGCVNPATRARPREGDHTHLTTTDDGQTVLLVDFDITLSVEETGQQGAKASLRIASVVKIGGGASSEETTRAAQRISFKVPLALPVDERSQARLQQHEADRKAKFDAMNRQDWSKRD